MACHKVSDLGLHPGKRRVVLVGNPNTGKSVVFQKLTGVYVDVSNFPGTTVDIASSVVGRDLIIDTPGVYGISSFNDEERVTRDMVLQADLVINVVNAASLDRDLFLTLQLVDMGIPMIVGMNMSDEAQRMGISIDLSVLEQELGVPVVPLVAVENTGIAEIKSRLQQAVPGKLDPWLRDKLPAGERRALQLLSLEGGLDSTGDVGEEESRRREQIYLQRRQRVNRLVDRCVQQNGTTRPWRKRLSSWMVRPLTGIPLLIGTLFLMYQFIGVFVAQTVVGFTEEILMGSYFQPWAVGLLSRVFAAESFLGNLLIGEFGLITMTVTYALGLLLPLVLGFYFALALLEDSGYLPRIAALLDRALMSIGLNGKAVIPMILGFGCVTMAVITTRVLGTKRERTIATFLLSLAIPCSAQLGVIAALLAPLGPRYLVIYVSVIAAVYVLVGTLLHRLLPGESSNLLLDLPVLRLPRLENVAAKTWSKTVHFLREAVPLFAAGSIMISLLDWFGLLTKLQNALAPLTEGWLRLPRETAVAFIMGIVRRDFGAAGLYDMSLTNAQTIVALVTITLFVPCIASVMVIWKERGWREWLAIFGGAFAVAFLIGGIVSRLI